MVDCWATARVVPAVQEKYVRGAYTYPSFGAEEGDRAALAAPVAGRLFFAGEATNESINPCMQVGRTGVGAGGRRVAWRWLERGVDRLQARAAGWQGVSHAGGRGRAGRGGAGQGGARRGGEGSNCGVAGRIACLAKRGIADAARQLCANTGRGEQVPGVLA